MPKTALILGHYNGRLGTLDTLKGYLESKNYETSLVLHPLDDYSKLPTKHISPSKTIVVERSPRGPLNLLGDLRFNLKVLGRDRPDVIIGTTNFDALPAIISRNLLRRRHPLIIYYPRDYADGRYSNRVLNQIYGWVESIVVQNADVTVSNTKRAEVKRLSHGLKPKRSLVISNPVSGPTPKFQPKKIRKDYFIYTGDVNSEHGLYELIETMAPLIKKLVLIGDGPDWDKTVDLAHRLKLELETHRAKDHLFVMDYLANFEGLGLAPYNLKKGWTYYASPLKIGEYIAWGIPVITSDIPEIAEDIVKDSLGIVYHDPDLATVIKQKVANLNTTRFERKADAFYKTHRKDVLFSKLPL
jgi:glycosyltransferase involved in cell wall biosynthesis